MTQNREFLMGAFGYSAGFLVGGLALYIMNKSANIMTGDSKILFDSLTSAFPHLFIITGMFGMILTFILLGRKEVKHGNDR